MVKRSKSTSDKPLEIKLLNQEEIAKRRVPVDDAEVHASNVRGNWLCTYCSNRFHSEARYMKHTCEEKRRHFEFKSTLGQAAYGYYRDWMQLKRYSAPGAAAFMESKFYRSFINFAQLVMDANISRPDKYMELMVEADISPVLWCREQCYSVYLGWMDKLSDPLDQVQESINYLMDICDKDGVDIAGVFKHLGEQQVIQLVRQRRLSPWLLFCAPSFGKFLKEMDRGHLKAFNTVVNSSYWGQRFQQERSTIDNIKTIVKAVRL